MMNFNDAYDLTGDKELAIELMKVEAEKLELKLYKNLLVKLDTQVSVLE